MADKEPLSIEKVEQIIYGLGYSQQQLDLTKYQVAKMLKLIHEERYQIVKTYLTAENKSPLILLSLVLLLENKALSQIVIGEINKAAAEQQRRLNLDNSNK